MVHSPTPSLAEIEQTRFSRKRRRLEERLRHLRRGTRKLYADDIAALERELATLRDQAG